MQGWIQYRYHDPVAHCYGSISFRACLISGSSLEQFFEEQGNKESPYDKLWNYMSSMDPSPMVSDVQDGYKRVKQGMNKITYFSVIFMSPQISSVKISTSSNMEILLIST